MKYAFGNGSFGCLYDNASGPYDTRREAADAAAYHLELSPRGRRELREHGYTERISGADYCEIFEVPDDWSWES
jgi:hypothetical protein